MIFKDRQHAGEQLAEALKKYAGPEVVVYALPRGGVTLGDEVAKKLGAPLDLVIARKIGHPDNPEYAIGAVTENGETVKNELEIFGLGAGQFEKLAAAEQQEAKRRRQAYLGGKKPLPATGRVCIIVDDGMATGLTMEVAIKHLRAQNPKKIIAAVPVCSDGALGHIEKFADEVVTLYVPAGFGAISYYYQDFPQLTDREVISILKEHSHDIIHT